MTIAQRWAWPTDGDPLWGVSFDTPDTWVAPQLTLDKTEARNLADELNRLCHHQGRFWLILDVGDDVTANDLHVTPSRAKVVGQRFGTLMLTHTHHGQPPAGNAHLLWVWRLMNHPGVSSLAVYYNMADADEAWERTT